MIINIVTFASHNQLHINSFSNVVNLLISNPCTALHLQFGALGFKSSKTRDTVKELKGLGNKHGCISQLFYLMFAIDYV